MTSDETKAAPAGELLDRVEAVRARLERHAASPPAGGLTEPDPPTGERWSWGQVWAHLAEFVPYWSGEVERIVASPSPGPVPFGRTKSDPVRVAAIGRDRDRPPAELMSRLSDQLDELRTLIGRLSGADWRRTGVHPTIGPMEMPVIFHEFLVGHLEAHADQLDGLRAGQPT